MEEEIIVPEFIEEEVVVPAEEENAGEVLEVSVSEDIASSDGLA